MNSLQLFTDSTTLAETAAERAVASLRRAIEQYGQASWVLAGGTTPMIAYRIIAARHLDSIDWSKVTFLLGDERISPLNSPYNNWQAIYDAFLQHLPDTARKLRPRADLGAEDAATDYTSQLNTLPKTADNSPRLDLVWLGMGEDGHTLSLFPNHPDFNPEDTRLVIPVHHSPKPPADRISLTIRALGGAQETLVLTSGRSKADALHAAMTPDSTLPVAYAVRATGADWLVDKDATVV